MTRQQEAITYFESQKKRLEDFRKIYPSPNTVGYQATTKEISFYDMAISALSENKGRWIGNGTCTYMCSNCKTEWTTSQIEKMCFCPTCGADMRGETRNEVSVSDKSNS